MRMGGAGGLAVNGERGWWRDGWRRGMDEGVGMRRSLRGSTFNCANSCLFFHTHLCAGSATNASGQCGCPAPFNPTQGWVHTVPSLHYGVVACAVCVGVLPHV